MTGKTKKISDIFFNILGLIVLSAMVITCIFFINPVRFIIYALIIAIILNFKNFRLTKISFKTTAQTFLITLFAAYLSIITIISLSPFLAVQEFRFSHQNWKQVEPKITLTKALWDNGYKRKGNTYADIYYQYEYQDKTYKNTEHEVLKMYYPFWDRRKSDILTQEFSQIISQKIEENDQIAFVDPNDKNSSRFFISRDLLFFRGSLLYDFVTNFVFCLLAFLLLIIVVVLFLMRKREENRRHF